MDIKSNIKSLKDNVENIKIKYGINYPIEIVAVSKTHPVEKIIEAYNAGLRVFGENKVQEGVKKIEQLRDMGYNDITWHMIGHLQTNKVKYVVNNFNTIQSVDREKLVDYLIKELKKNDSKIDIMIEVNTSYEEQKSGVNPDNYFKLLDYILENGENYINLIGLMTVGPLTEDEKKIRKSFKLLNNLFYRTNEQYKNLHLKYLSMGMSGDYEIAIAEGSNMIRVGTIIFGKREYFK